MGMGAAGIVGSGPTRGENLTVLINENTKPNLEVRQPTWANQLGLEDVPAVPIVTKEAVSILDNFPHGPRMQAKSGEKSYGADHSLAAEMLYGKEGESVSLEQIIMAEGTEIVGELGNPTCIIVPSPEMRARSGASLISVKPHTLWLPGEYENFQNTGELPKHAIAVSRLVHRTASDDRTLIDPAKMAINGNCGPEIEFVVFDQAGNQVDASQFIAKMIELGYEIDGEGLTCQLEFNPGAFVNGTDPEAHNNYRTERYKGIASILEAAEKLGLTIAVQALLAKGDGHANLYSAHVQNLRNAMGTEGNPLSFEELNSTISDISRASGTHVTADLAAGRDGFVSAERLARVANLCAGNVALALRAFNLNGNTASADDLATGELSYRRRAFRNLQTAQTPVAVVSRFDEYALGANRRGAASFLERSAHAHIDEDGNYHYGKGYHNPLVRAKDGRVEYVGSDAEANIDKVLALMTTWKVYVDIVDVGVLYSDEDKDGVPKLLMTYFENAKQKYGNRGFDDSFHPKNFIAVNGMAGNIEKLVETIDKYGFDAEIPMADGELIRVGDYLAKMIDWIQVMAEQMYEDKDGSGTPKKVYQQPFYDNLDFLKGTIDRVAPTFADYFDMNGGYYGAGNLAQIFRKRWFEALERDMNQDRGMLLQRLKNEQQAAWREYIFVNAAV